MYVKWNTIPHVDALYKLKFGNEKEEIHENAEDKILQMYSFLKSNQNRNKVRPHVKQDP